MNSTVDFDNISRFLNKTGNITFALVFGSTATGKGNRFSDVDIGIHTQEELSLPELGKIVAGLEKIVKKEVDLVVLNDLFKQKPYFAFQIVSTARLLFTNNLKEWVNFKRKVFLSYLDVKPMLDMMKASLEKRIRTGKFGERNYA